MNKIKIIDEQNNEIDAEIVMTFGKNNTYIIYKIKKDYYIAKYYLNNNKYYLDTNNLTDEIINIGEKILNKYITEV